MQLGILEKVNLRNFWKNESGDFTPWLAKEEYIALLSEAINLELEVQSQEESVGPLIPFYRHSYYMITKKE